MSKKNPFKYFKTSPDIIHLAVMYYLRYPPGYRQVEHIMHERGIDVCHETVRNWIERFGLLFANEILQKKKRLTFKLSMAPGLGIRKFYGEQFYLWRAVDHEVEVLECFVKKRRDKRLALIFLVKAMKKYGEPKIFLTDKLRSYGAALKEMDTNSLQDTTQYLNHRCENSHLSFRRRERAILSFRSPAMLQRFISIHSQIYNHFNH